MTRSSANLLLAIAVSGGLSAVNLQATENYEITTRDGRVITGKIDHRTNREQIWLMTSQGGVEVSTGFWWNDLISGSIGEHTLGIDQLRAHALANTPLEPNTSKLTSALVEVMERLLPIV